jgi:tRNA (guanine37-N1)-methyltransferase
VPDEPSVPSAPSGEAARPSAPPDETARPSASDDETARPSDETAVRLATPDDVPALAALAALTFPLACPPSIGPEDARAFIAAHLSPGRLREHLADPDRRVLVAPDEAGALVGYTLLVLGEPRDEDAAAAVRLRPTAELSKCYVHPDRHGTGTAAALMTASLAAARGLGASGVWLGVNQHNARAQRFYAKSGFAVVGTKQFTVGGVREDDYVMERAL